MDGFVGDASDGRSVFFSPDNLFPAFAFTFVGAGNSLDVVGGAPNTAAAASASTGLLVNAALGSVPEEVFVPLPSVRRARPSAALAFASGRGDTGGSESSHEAAAEADSGSPGGPASSRRSWASERADFFAASA